MSHIFDNHGNKVEYIPGLKVGDLLRAKKTVERSVVRTRHEVPLILIIEIIPMRRRNMTITIGEKDVLVENINHPNDVYIYFGENHIVWNKVYSPAMNIWRNGQIFVLDTKTFNLEKLRNFLR